MKKQLLTILLLIPLSSLPGSAQPATSSYCIVVSNALYPNLRPISVEVDGYSGYWVIAANELKALVNSSANDVNQLVRGASFTLRVYEGSQGQAGALLASTTISGDGNVYSPHTISTPVSPANASGDKVVPECTATGYWNVLVHD